MEPLSPTINLLKEVYTPTSYQYDLNYTTILKTLNGINDNLKQDGVIYAPNDDSLLNTSKLYDLIGRPLDKIPTIHIGGTNGKGTTSFKLAECLRSSGLKTGLFVSPHITCYRERLQINSKLIKKEELIFYAKKILNLCVEYNIPATLFEVTFIIGCLYYEKNECDVVVLEVGLGGQMDATNVVDAVLSVICSISLDHTRILGSTVEEIALKKSGIFKNGKFALIGPTTLSIMKVFKDAAIRNSTTLYTMNDIYERYVYNVSKLGEIDRNIWGNYLYNYSNNNVDDTIIDTDDLNSYLVLSSLYILKDMNLGKLDIINIFSEELLNHTIKLRPPCRWEINLIEVPIDYINNNSNINFINQMRCININKDVIDKISNRYVEVIFDIAHNPGAISALVRKIKRDYIGRVIHILYAVSKDKDVKSCLKDILTVTTSENIHFTKSGNFRAASVELLNKYFKEEVGHDKLNLETSGEIKDIINKIVNIAAIQSDNSVVIVCGSSYIMPESKLTLGIYEERDDN